MSDLEELADKLYKNCKMLLLVIETDFMCLRLVVRLLNIHFAKFTYYQQLESMILWVVCAPMSWFNHSW